MSSDFEPDHRALRQHEAKPSDLRQHKPSPKIFEPPDRAGKILSIMFWVLFAALVVYIGSTVVTTYTGTTPADWIESLRD